MSAQTRRTVLGASLTAGLSAAGVAVSCSGDKSPERNWIDAHVHVWTPDQQAYPISPNFSEKEMEPASFQPAELFAEQKGSGVSRTVLIQMSFYEFDNRYMLDSMAKYPGRFGGVAIVDAETEGVAQTMKDLGAQGVRGFRLYAFPDRVKDWEASKGIQAMWKTGGEEGLAMCCLTDPASLPVIHRMCQAYPETRVVIDHFARIGLQGEVDQAVLDQLLAMADFPNTYLKTSAFYALGKKTPPYTDLADMYRQVRDAFGSERLMWGSDCPYQVQGEHTYDASLSLVTDELDFLTEQDKENILRNTAEKLFFS
tara:strand:- start:8915 stop:9850 length:936 start_codon:yes stop_codon:yes gene_type:complete